MSGSIDINPEPWSTKTTLRAHIGILSPLEPWSAVNAPGAEEGILQIRQ